jgi:hypothetical protein
LFLPGAAGGRGAPGRRVRLGVFFWPELLRPGVVCGWEALIKDEGKGLENYGTPLCRMPWAAVAVTGKVEGKVTGCCGLRFLVHGRPSGATGVLPSLLAVTPPAHHESVGGRA